MNEALLDQLLAWANKFMAENECVSYTHPDGRLYIEAWCVYDTWPMQVILHKFHSEDPGWPLHDHPARSLSLCLEGSMTERYAPDSKNLDVTVDRVIKAGDLIWRGTDFWHRLPVGKNESALTLYISGETLNEEYKFNCPNGKVPNYIFRQLGFKCPEEPGGQ